MREQIGSSTRFDEKNGKRSFAKVEWRVEDILDMAEQMGILISPQEAEAFLEESSRQIQDDMVERGWSSIETLLEMRQSNA